MPTKTKKLEPDIFTATHMIVSPDDTQTENTVPVLRCPPEDPTCEQTMKLVEVSGVLDFWNRPEEDGYTDTDGEPI